MAGARSLPSSIGIFVARPDLAWPELCRVVPNRQKLRNVLSISESTTNSAGYDTSRSPPLPSYPTLRFFLSGSSSIEKSDRLLASFHTPAEFSFERHPATIPFFLLIQIQTRQQCLRPLHALSSGAPPSPLRLSAPSPPAASRAPPHHKHRRLPRRPRTLPPSTRPRPRRACRVLPVRLDLQLQVRRRACRMRLGK